MHSTLHLVSLRGEEYTTEPHRDWDVDAECLDLELSFAALDIGSDASESGVAFSSNPRFGYVEQAS